MEAIIKKRHPDSIPVMIWAANHEPSSTHDDAASLVNGSLANSKKPASVDFLEKRIAKLESELDSRDEDAKRDLRVLEQKHEVVRLQYEDRVRALEARLTTDATQRPHSSTTAIQRELDSVRERNRKEVAELKQEIEKLRKQHGPVRSRETGAIKRLYNFFSFCNLKLGFTF